MVSPSKPKHSRVASQQQSHKCKLIKGAKPLVNHKFYLDVEKHHISSKIEVKIKELGGSIEFFLDKGVTHFITDKHLERDRSCISPLSLTPKTPQTPHTPFLSDLTDVASPNVDASNESRATGSKHRSRADAMLHRARVQTNDNNIRANISQSPVQLAKSWGTPIWTTEYTLRFLDKVSAALKLDYASSSSKVKPANVKHLKGDYIKIESFQKEYRPYYQEINPWPMINLNSTCGYTPFIVQSEKNKRNDFIKRPRSSSNRMTRKSRSKQMRTKNEIKRSSEKQCGYCEICRVEYDILSIHLQSKEHLNFVKNGDNFLALDSLIKNSANVDTFLKVNHSPRNDIDSGIFGKRTARKVAKLIRACDIELKKESDNEINAEDYGLNGDTRLNLLHKYSPPMTRRSNSRRTDPVSPKSIKSSPPKINVATPLEFEIVSPLRARRESVKRVNYAEPREDEENSNDSKTKIEKIRLRGIRWRAPSSDEQSSVPQPIVYKVVEDKPKSSLKSSSNRKGPLSEQNKDSNGLKVKICRVRESELSLLTNEADNFMFPRNMSDIRTDEDRQSTSEPAEISTDIVSSELDPVSPVAHTSKKESKEKSKRKRRKHLEVFLNDNTEYYKFENPDSRLRFQEAPIQPTLIKIEHKTETKSTTITSPKCDAAASVTANIRELEDGMGEFNCNESELLSSDIARQYNFAFERIPSSESWYGAFQRQDENRETIFEYWGNTAYRKLPYEMGPLPPLSSDCCILSKLKLKNSSIKQNYRRKCRSKKKKQLKTNQLLNCKSELDVDNANTTMDEIPNRIEEPLIHPEIETNTDVIPSESGQQEFLVQSSKELLEPRNNISKLPDDLGNKSEIPTFSNPVEKESQGKSIFTEVNPNADLIDTKPKAILSSIRRNTWLDLGCQPRKSPREHASTLAILSCLVQERRKLEKEINGGISQEHIEMEETDNYGNNLDETNVEPPEVNDANDQMLTEATAINIESDQMEIEIIEDINTKVDIDPHTEEDSSLAVILSLQNKLEMESDILPTVADDHVAMISTDHCNELHKEGADLPSIANTATDVNDTNNTNKIPLPVVDYVDPNLLCRQLNVLLNSTYQENIILSDVSLPKKCDDLILVSTPKDFMDIITSIGPGPLRYNSNVNLRKRTGLSSFVKRGRKRRNKTGWPSLPKRKLIIKNENEFASCSNSVTNTDAEEEQDDNNSVTEDRVAVDISKRLENETDEFFIRSRQKLNSLGEDCSKYDDYSNDGNNSVIFTSSSEKAENSDIFTVSSDSLDTVINDHKPDKDYDAISVKSLINLSDESSADITLAEMLKKQIGVGQQPIRRPKKKKSKKKMKKKKSPKKVAITTKLTLLQPVVCVKKINDIDLVNAFCSAAAVQKNKLSPTSNSGKTTTTSNRNSCSPKSKFSPRKLRKPRGRWYRER